MRRLRLTTAGESHGPAVVATLRGLPHGLEVSRERIDADLARRQQGHGRGARMAIEQDRVEVLAGLRGGRTLGSPLVLAVRNRDHEAWRESMDPFVPGEGGRVTCPRPGHADLAGALKLGLTDARDVLERASARATVARVAAGSVASQLLGACGVELLAHVRSIGGMQAPEAGDLEAARSRAEASPVRCADAASGARMVAAIDAALAAGDSLGGVVEVVAWGLPAGLGGHAEWDERLDGRLAQAAMSVPAIKAVELGDGFAASQQAGSAVHDPILHDGLRFHRPTNHAGGLEGGMTNGEPLVLRAAMKPIPTLARPLPSVDLETYAPADAQRERTDCCAVPAAAVVVEAAVALTLADALLERLGGETMDEVLEHLAGLRRDLGARRP